MTSQDSIQTVTTSSQEAPIKASGTRHGGYHTPREILSWLPNTATPWQQDSAIRANYKFPDIDWSKRPNPMRTPTTKADSASDFSLTKPLYHSKSLIQPDSVYRPEFTAYQQGVAGDPIPYNVANDNLITSILLGCFILVAMAIAETGNSIGRQFKNFFHQYREGTTVISETSNELRFQFFLLLQASLLFALIFFFYSKTIDHETISLPQYVVIGIFTGIISVYFLVKFMFHSLVGWVFFDNKKIKQCVKSLLFISGSESIVLFPAVIFHAYFNFSMENMAFYTAFIVILAKILSFYKIHTIFFKRNGAFVQSFLYFCAFEMIPLGVLWGVLVFTDQYLKVNF